MSFSTLRYFQCKMHRMMRQVTRAAYLECKSYMTSSKVISLLVNIMVVETVASVGSVRVTSCSLGVVQLISSPSDILGHVRCTDDTGVVTVQPQTVTILARLESFLSSWKFTLDASSEGGQGLWENMPSAHEHHPRFAVSSMGRFDFLALAERDKKRIRPAPLTQLFLYRLPSHTELRRKLAESIKAAELRSEPVKRSVHPTTSTSYRSSKFVVPRMPLCLTTIQGDVVDLKFSAVNDETCTVSASTVDTTRTWEIQDR